jgi:glycine oxidase
MDDCLILGGGVIGLSLAFELAQQGRSVHVIDRRSPGEEASWAGAGIIPPGPTRTDAPPYEQLAALAYRLHSQWSDRLRELTAIDNGYRRCGALHVARDDAARRALLDAVDTWRRLGIKVENVEPAHLCEREPGLSGIEVDRVQAACLLPDEGQIRNPRHVKALVAACHRVGVRISAGVEAEDFIVRGGRIEAVRSNVGLLTAEQFCVAGGAWSRGLLVRLGFEPRMKPIRGQMVLLAHDRRLLERVINEGPRYLVPRTDGHVLVGSTEEDAGFDKSTTGSGIDGLLSFALSLAPRLAVARFERCWAGLRPGTADGLPYLGRLPGLDNGFVATGHFRSGLQLSPATAVLMAQLMRGQRPEVDLETFRIGRMKDEG